MVKSLMVKVSPVTGKAVEVEKPQKADAIPDGAITSPMQGMVLAIKVKVGDKVAAGDIVAVIEAMKMQNEIATPHGGTVQKILSFEGEVVTNGDVILVVSPQ